MTGSIPASTTPEDTAAEPQPSRSGATPWTSARATADAPKPNGDEASGLGAAFPAASAADLEDWSAAVPGGISGVAGLERSNTVTEWQLAQPTTPTGIFVGPTPALAATEGATSRAELGGAQSITPTGPATLAGSAAVAAVAEPAIEIDPGFAERDFARNFAGAIADRPLGAAPLVGTSATHTPSARTEGVAAPKLPAGSVPVSAIDPGVEERDFAKDFAAAFAARSAGAAPLAGTSASPAVSPRPTGTPTPKVLSPQARATLEVLKVLRAAYGGDPATAPGTGGVSTASTGAGDGKTMRALRATELYQRMAMAAFRNLDEQLAAYLTSFAGSQRVDRAALGRFLTQLDVELAAVGGATYTPAGQQKVRAILTAALQRGQSLVGATNANAADTAAAIDQLTAQYLVNLVGGRHSGLAIDSGGGPGRQAALVALRQQGVPYVWGGTTPSGFDCSGLMQYAARASGASIPRTSQEQYERLPPVSPSAIRPGDLIFPSSSMKGGQSPTHVMMYLGNNQCVEAPRTGLNVRVVALPDTFEAARWS
ncbi:C40 family peptidase [Nocardia yamanashiensis]|uniref:C40 family peptidase n=1 Tax=Nocardia yamanashiensis TaxID=209247 RepID=UPI00082B7BEF|nr:NlpC/P60 family protein [Nocardia yamanashiensis]